jgi:hypothetical protein
MTERTEWDVDSTKHDVIINNSREIIIREVLIKKCSFYYEFDSLLRNSFIVNFLFVMKSTRSDSSENSSLVDESNAKLLYSQIKSTHEKNENEIEDENEDKNENEIFTNISNKKVQTNVIKSRANLNKRVRRLIKLNNKKVPSEIKRNRTTNSDSEKSTSKITKRESKIKSITDAMIEMQSIKFKNFITRFKYEIRQRN